MVKTIIANDIRRITGIKPGEKGKRCFITFDSLNKIEMVYNQMRTKPGGLVWFFVCPITGKRCRKLHLINGMYVHTSCIKGYYRNNRPAWFTESKFNEILKLKQAAINAEKQLSRKHFKSHYAGKPSKRYLKCLKQIESAKEISLQGIVNGQYDYLLKFK